MRLRLCQKPRNGLSIKCWATWKYQASSAVLVGATVRSKAANATRLGRTLEYYGLWRRRRHTQLHRSPTCGKL